MSEKCFICDDFISKEKISLESIFFRMPYEIYENYEDTNFEYKDARLAEQRLIVDLKNVGSIVANNPFCSMCRVCVEVGINNQLFESSYSYEGFFNKKNRLTLNSDKIKKSKSKWKEIAIESYQQKINEYKKIKNKENGIRKSIVDMLTKKSIKMTISDITAIIKKSNIEFPAIDEELTSYKYDYDAEWYQEYVFNSHKSYIKDLLENMYEDGDIDFAGNGRYFILSEEKKKPKPKKTSASKSEEVDVEKELEKYKGLLDKGLITQEQYDAKSNELLGL